MSNQDNNGDLSYLSDLEKRLYQQGKTSNTGLKRSKLAEKYKGFKTDWGDSSPESFSSPKFFSSNKLLSYVLIAAVLFFVVTLTIAGFILFSGSNIISNRNIDLKISGPTVIKAGDITSFQLTLVNRNKIPLEQVKLSIEYPPDTRSATGTTNTLTKLDENIGVIMPGETINKTLQAILFGRENTPKDIKATISYRITGSNAIYTKEADFGLVISSPSINVSIDLLPEATSGQDISFDVRLFSNAQTPLDSVSLVLAYPSGFEFESSSLEPVEGDNVWFFDNFPAGQERIIKINGKLTGQNKEIKTFQATVGNAPAFNPSNLGTIFSDLTKTINIKDSFLSLNLNVNNYSSESPVVSSNSQVRVDALWANNLNDRVIDGDLKIKISGPAFDRNKVMTNQAFYRSVDQTVEWDKLSLPSLAGINPGTNDRAFFSFQTLSLLDSRLSGVKNPTITLEATLTGTRVSEGFTNETIVSKLTREIKLQSVFQVAVGLLQRTGPFNNSGPLPPVVDQETTYTITLSVLNSSNDVSGAVATMTLPPNVRYLGEFSPSDSNVRFNEVNRQIIWDLGNVSAGVGTVLPARELAIKLGLTPSQNQVGDSPVILTDVNLTGVDTFTGTNLQDSKRPLTTRVANESGYRLQDGIVIGQ